MFLPTRALSDVHSKSSSLSQRARRLGVSELDDGHGEDVEAAKDDESLPAEAVEHDGDDEYVLMPQPMAQPRMVNE